MFGSIVLDIGKGLLPLTLEHSTDPLHRTAHVNLEDCYGLFTNLPIGLELRVGRPGMRLVSDKKGSSTRKYTEMAFGMDRNSPFILQFEYTTDFGETGVLLRVPTTIHDLKQAWDNGDWVVTIGFVVMTPSPSNRPF